MGMNLWRQVTKNARVETQAELKREVGFGRRWMTRGMERASRE